MKRFPVVAVLILFTLLLSFTIEEEPENNYKIILRFTKNYPNETFEKKQTGLIWALSYLGAELPKGCMKHALISIDSTAFELNLDKLGFNENALNALGKLVIEAKATDEYKKMDGIELGEFIIYTLGSSWHYYEITGVPKKLETYKNKLNDSEGFVFPVTNSAVAKAHRKLLFSGHAEIEKKIFMAIEGHGNLANNTFEEGVTEVMDIMPNGQLRFAIYDKEGNLIDASPRQSGLAGKPVKCLWCHEIVIQPLFSKNEKVEGYMSPDSFNIVVKSQMKQLEQYRAKLKTEVKFTNRQDHAFMEMLYISYMQPSAYKLSNEWKIDKAKLSKKLKGLKKHDHYEYPFLNGLYHRGDIKKYAPYKTLALPDSIWEPNPIEPSVFLNKHY